MWTAQDGLTGQDKATCWFRLHPPPPPGTVQRLRSLEWLVRVDTSGAVPFYSDQHNTGRGEGGG